MVRDALRGYLALASGVSEVTAARARAAARVLAEQGEATAGQVTSLAEDLVATSRRNREGLVLIIRHEIEATLRRLGLGPAGDLDALTQRVRRLEQTLRDLERGRATGRTVGSGEAGGSTAKKSPAKKTSAKKTSPKKSSAKKSTAKKSTAKKSTAKKSTSKRAAGRAPRRTSGRRS